MIQRGRNQPDLSVAPLDLSIEVSNLNVDIPNLSIDTRRLIVEFQDLTVASRSLDSHPGPHPSGLSGFSFPLCDSPSRIDTTGGMIPCPEIGVGCHLIQPFEFLLRFGSLASGSRLKLIA
uniref:Uncharacterized protein n=1 Tax=Candidatus Kentrum sp. SD TaxID=2126332 RepID=A0A450YCG4_9GAMM|nr:MAG: hypothetical protein BECKSD772F_GA0070984_100258 [Candidatus Kentron sp. SD]VFK39240.1 MAG: hypothetical protein BECKSD772E_GA0070983_100256 [Candidatus Kentron sp. SD]VFK77840.1 MAG: hypothetical protein BECKSD772D_GA0070982_100254 [Candidatus Kentron sp. SD]